MTTILILAFVVGILMALAIGANDVANSMASAVGAKAITIKQAVIIAFFLEFAGAFFFGKMVANTIRKGIVDPALITDPAMLVAGALAALIAGAICVLLATSFSLPISTTHSIVGGMTGFGIIALGWSAINWGKMMFIVLSWFVSPFLGGLLAFLIFRLVSRTILHKKDSLGAAKKIGPFFVGLTFFIVMFMFFVKGWHKTWQLGITLGLLSGFIATIVGYFLIKKVKDTKRKDGLSPVEGIFKNLQIITSCYVSIAHGANDVANAIGPLAAIYAVATTGIVASKAPFPKWILAFGGLGIAIGVAVWGHKVMKTVGEGITELNNTRGFSIDFATATTVLLASLFGLPVSSTHTVVGSVVGVGYARGIEALNLKILKDIAISWVVTVPLAAIISIAFYKLLFPYISGLI